MVGIPSCQLWSRHTYQNRTSVGIGPRCDSI